MYIYIHRYSPGVTEAAQIRICVCMCIYRKVVHFIDIYIDICTYCLYIYICIEALREEHSWPGWRDHVVSARRNRVWWNDAAVVPGAPKSETCARDGPDWARTRGTWPALACNATCCLQPNTATRGAAGVDGPHARRRHLFRADGAGPSIPCDPVV